MGFWSSVRSSVSSFVSSAVDTVSSAVHYAWDTVKDVASRAVVFMSEKAESLVGGVKKLWAMVKPHLEKVRTMLITLAPMIPYPWLKGAVLGLERLLATLENFDKSALAKKLNDAIAWAIAAAQKLKETFLTDAEMKAAKERKRAFAEAANHATAGQQHGLDLVTLINDYVMVQTGIKNLMENEGIDSFEHYLRLRATQKLLNHVEAVLQAAQTTAEISSDDIFLVSTGAALLAEQPELSDANAQRLDRIVERRYGKKLIPFVFEEMIGLWSQTWTSSEMAWEKENKNLAKDRSLLRRLSMEQRLSTLEPQDAAILAGLQDSVPVDTARVDTMAEQQRYLRKYVGAAEGFLQMLEQDGATLEAEGKGFLAEEGGRVGKLIIDCAQHGKSWSSLTEEEQALITDFANIFEEASKARAEQLIEVKVA